MNERPPIINLATFEGLDNAERELTISKLVVEIHDWLTRAADDPEVPIWELSSTRAYAADIVTAIRRLNLSVDLRLDAMLVLRLAERIVGKAVRRGQAAGELGSLGTNNYAEGQKLPSPQPYVGAGTTAHQIYKMVDDVTDAQFAAVLQEARAEGKLTRGLIIRRLTGVQDTRRTTDGRRDLLDQARELAEQLRKITVKLRKLADDDRLLRNRAEVAARMRYYLSDAETVCADLRNTLDKE